MPGLHTAPPASLCSLAAASLSITQSDGAVAAVQLLEFHGDAVDGAAVAGAWLSCLPLTVDEVEARVAHEQLVRTVEQSDPRRAPELSRAFSGCC